MKKHRTSFKEIKVGGVIIIALVIMVVTVFFIGGKKKLFGNKVSYRIHFDSTGGLYVGDPVLLTGVEIGNVTRIGFPEEIGTKKILVEISVLKEVSGRIRKDTRARVAAASLVYGKVVELTMGSMEESEIHPGDMIEADESSSYTAIVDSTTLMVDDIRRILSKMDQGEGLVGLLLNEPLEMRQTLSNLSTSSNRLARILERVDRGESPLGVLFSDSVEFHQTLIDFQEAVKDFKEISSNLKGSESVAAKLMNDEVYGEAFTKDLQSAVHSIASIAAKIDTGRGTLGSLINDKGLIYGLENVVLGVESNSLAKWLIRNRRNAGEEERMKIEAGRE
ncbi:MCE family protein [bacterium]|nr:MCE family protein [bacterium]RQV93270.1 MAG: MCE family protein [bacterium]